MPAPPEIEALVARFELHREDYLRGDYNETQVRREFLDPVFKALGWDVDNAQGHAEAYKDVVHEDALRVSGGHKAPDYGFRIGGTRKFFVEAKKPAVNIREDYGHAFQLRRYGWSAKLPLSILTSFDEWAVYDTRVRPTKDDKPSTARVLYLRGRELVDRWDELAAIFSREAILKGSFDKFAESNKKKRGTAEVDSAFLAEIESWREELAKNLALRNGDLSQRDLNFAVQRIIDRIIFLRIAEDRGIEDYGRLLAVSNGPGIYGRLAELFRQADDRYNSGLFHFEPEKGRLEPPDELTLALQIDDKLLRDLIRGLYYPESPYEFAVLSADILGQVYEQFLGKVIRLAGKRAIVEDKPEVKKAGGVFYTPTYIVDYIVRQTVGKLLEGKTPKQAAKLRVLDPACGSGSFLIGAYQFLLDWHRDWYLAGGAEKHTKLLYRDAAGAWRLTTAERKRILLNNIYGVDIDAQAVEVTKLSLLLKVLEGASREALERQRRFLHERALPDLGANIKCGNSLIGPDFYDGRQMDLFDEEEQYRLNVFDWSGKDGFPQIMKAGGFDAVIGNPPYIRIQGFPRPQIDYLATRYVAAIKNADIYVSFVERGLELLAKGGRLGNILPNKFFKTDYGESLRRLLSAGRFVSDIVDFGAGQVFGATTYTCLLFLRKCSNTEFRYVRCEPNSESVNRNKSAVHSHSQLTDGIWTFEDALVTALLGKLAACSVPLLSLPSSMSRGSSTGCDDVFMFRPRELRIEKGIVRRPLFATDFRRYDFGFSEEWRVIYPYVNDRDEGYRLLDEPELRSRFPLAYAHLLRHKKTLTARKQFRAWYGYSAPRNLVEHDKAQILIPLLANRGLFTLAPEEYKGALCPMASGGFTVRVHESCPLRPEFVLACLNSRLLF